MSLEVVETGASPESLVVDKKGYASRWKFSPRMVDNFLAEGMPHMKFGLRRVRIITAEADAWLRERYGTQRRKSVAPVLHSAESAAPKTARKPRKQSLSAD